MSRPRPELYIGLVCAAGTDLSEVRRQLKAQLSVADYQTVEIKVSEQIADNLGITPPTEYVGRTECLMDAGDNLRRHSEQNDGVASVIVSAIRSERIKDRSDKKPICFLLDSLKKIRRRSQSSINFTVGTTIPLRFIVLWNRDETLWQIR